MHEGVHYCHRQRGRPSTNESAASHQVVANSSRDFKPDRESVTGHPKILARSAMRSSKKELTHWHLWVPYRWLWKHLPGWIRLKKRWLQHVHQKCWSETMQSQRLRSRNVKYGVEAKGFGNPSKISTDHISGESFLTFRGSSGDELSTRTVLCCLNCWAISFPMVPKWKTGENSDEVFWFLRKTLRRTKTAFPWLLFIMSAFKYWIVTSACPKN